MKNPLIALVSAVVALVLASCLQHETTIHLNKDGSGKIVEETRLGAQMMAMMAQMGEIGGGESNPLTEMFSEEKAKTRAAELGEGVTFEKSERIDANGAKGARVTYQFKDINQLKLSTTGGIQNLSPMGAAAPETKPAEPIGFAYADGKLTITMPKPKAAPEQPADAPGAPDMESPEVQAMMKQMLADMKIGFKVVIEPGIAETNATHHSGNTITLMEMEMGKVLEKADTFAKLSKVGQDDPAAATELLKGIEGVKVETQEQITVKVD